MASANGYVLEVSTRSGGTHELVAYWPAPYFVFIDDTEKATDVPALYHAESLADAQRIAKAPHNGKATILNAAFGLTI